MAEVKVADTHGRYEKDWLECLYLMPNVICYSYGWRRGGGEGRSNGGRWVGGAENPRALFVFYRNPADTFKEIMSQVVKRACFWRQAMRTLACPKENSPGLVYTTTVGMAGGGKQGTHKYASLIPHLPARAVRHFL